MDLKKRLAQLDRLTRKNEPERGPRRVRSAAETQLVLDGLGLVRHDGTAGPVWFLEHVDEMGPPETPLPDLTGLFSAGSAGCPPLSGVLFLDTETTGLAGGTGTLVFQVGTSWWDGGRLLTRQYFLPGPADEAAMLLSLTDLASGFTHVVTFNGASFDLPLLRTRALLNRLADPLGSLIGWDLLVPARRLWRHCLPDCRQQTVEAHLCGRQRGGGDIDGSCIPQTWFDFLHSGEPGLLGNVLTHNHRDMLGMARVFRRVCEVAGWLMAAEQEMFWPPQGLGADRCAAWALGRVYERRAAKAAAAACFSYGCATDWGVLATDRQRGQFRRDAIRNLKRTQAWDLVEKLIHDGLESAANEVALHIEAAILYEHRLVDLERALSHAQQAGDDHRVARLVRLLAR